MFTKKNLGLGLLAFVFANPAVSETPKDGLSTLGETANKTTGGSGAGTGIKATPTASTTESPGGLTDAQLEKKIGEFLLKNPQLIVHALQDFQKREMHAQEEKVKASLMKYKDEIAKDSSSVVLGKKDAEIKLVVFLDPNCPHCRPFSLALHKAHENFPNLGIFIRHWAILGKDSEDVVRGLWAIKQQGDDKFNAATHAIATSEEKYTFATLLSWVKDHKLDVKKFEADANSQPTKDVIEETKKLATSIGFEYTPTSLLIDKNGIRLVMPTDEKSLEAILKSAGKDDPAKT